MTPRELLVQLREKGVELKSNGDRLVIDAPKGAITPDMRDALAANKAELLKILNTPPPIEKPAAPPIERPAPPKPEPRSSVTEQPVAPPRSQTVAPAAPPAPPPNSIAPTAPIAREVE